MVMLYHGDPLLADAGDGSSACTLCKCILKDATDLAAHLASEAHSSRARAAIANGTLRTASPIRDAVLRTWDAVLRTPRNMIMHGLVRALVQNPTLNDLVLWLLAPPWTTRRSVSRSRAQAVAVS